MTKPNTNPPRPAGSSARASQASQPGAADVVSSATLDALPLDVALLGAVARGWCYAGNTDKEMDTKLAMAIAVEVAKLFSARSEKQESAEQVRHQVIKAAHRPGPMCRDCGDRDGTCYDGKKCDPFEAALDLLRSAPVSAIQANNDTFRLDWLHDQLKLTVADAFQWPVIPQDKVSWRAKIDDQIHEQHAEEDARE